MRVDNSLRSFCLWIFCPVLLAFSFGPMCCAQPESPLYARGNSFGILFAYSNDSGHMLFGQAEQRKLLNIGVSYSRKLIADRVVNWQYDGELLPVALESDPLTRNVIVQTSPKNATVVINGDPPMTWCGPVVTAYSVTVGDTTYAGTVTSTCHGRQWTMGESMAPAGMQLNFMPRHKLQPLVESHGGYMFSTHPIPIPPGGSFNFTVDAGVGFEYYRTSRQSFRAEYRYHHISNHDTTFINPGIDSGVFQVSYVFGR